VAYTATVSSIFFSYNEVSKVLLKETDLNLEYRGLSTGNTLLMWASIFGNYDAAAYFIAEAMRQAIPLISQTNLDGDTALSLALKHGHRDIALLLQNNGA
jgi:ankyrin repeat protein